MPDLCPNCAGSNVARTLEGVARIVFNCYDCDRLFVLSKEPEGIPYLRVDLVEPANGDSHYYGMRVTRYRDNSVVAIWQRDYFHSTEPHVALEGLRDITNDYTATGGM